MKNELLSGAFILGAGAFFAKLLGAIYRIPLTNILGPYGLGLYQMVFPLYTLLLDFSGAGAPNAISKIISSYFGEDKNNYAYNVLQVSKKIFSFLGLAFSSLMLSFSYIISYAQGNTDSTLAYIFLSPSVFLVCLLSSYRGYFQGLMKMSPTSFSQIIEQTIKLIFGLLLAYVFRKNVIYAVAGATFAITISEAVALLFLYLLYKKNISKYNMTFYIEKENQSSYIRLLIKNVVPIALIGVMIPFSQVADSFIIVNTLKCYNDNAMSLYGILTGVVNTVVNLPVSICYSIATVVIPLISKEKSYNERKRKSFFSLLFTFFISSLFVLVILFFPDKIITILFRKLTSEDKELSINLLKILSINVLLISCLQTSNGILIGNGKLYYPLISMGAGVITKIILNIILLKNKNLNIYGSAIALITCFFLSDLINLFMIIKSRDKYANQTNTNRNISN